VSWLTVALECPGWLDEDEGDALFRHAESVVHLGPLCEIGGYAGKSACWLGAVAANHDTVLFSVDWHRGSPEMAAGRECHDPEMVGPDGLDTLPHFRRNIRDAGLEPWVVPVVGSSPKVGAFWSTPLGFLFIDGAHDDGVLADFDLWAPHVVPGGLLAFHDCEIPVIAKAVDMAEQAGWTRVEQVGCLQVLQR
jgi:predicted O-methyltransferase YrrM